MREFRMVLSLSLGVIALGCRKEPDAAAAADSAATKADSVATMSVAIRPAAPPREVILPVREMFPGALAQAKILPIDAQHLALTKYPTGAVKGAEIGRRGKDLAYSYFIQQPGETGVEEVLVNALDGQVITAIHRDDAVLRKVMAAKAPKP